MNQNDVELINENHNTPQDTLQDKIINFCIKERSLQEIMNFIELNDKKYFKKRYLKPLIQQGKLSMTIPDKPTSKYQKYVTICSDKR